MYQLFCDSNCELWHTTVKELGLNVIRMPYTIDNEEHFYDMGEHHDFKAFFDKMRAGATPKTSALNAYDYIEYFEPVLARGEDIYYITFSHQMSGTFHAMQQAIEELKEKYPDRVIRFKDSKLISVGSGCITYHGALQYKNGATMDELDAYLDELIDHTSMYFTVDDLTYLHRGGRISGFAKVFGGLLNIHPILYFNEEGKIINIAKAKGTKKSLSTLLDFMKTKGSELDQYRIYILQADNEETAEYFADMIRKQFSNLTLDIAIRPVGPVIGSHCGPGTIGVAFHSKEK